MQNNLRLKREQILSQLLLEDKLATLKQFGFDQNEKEEVLKILSGIQKYQLFPSKIHGLYHSEKVMLFSYLLAKLEHLDEVDKQIIIDASLYHDCRRSNDRKDPFHGLAGANYIDSIVHHPIYKEKKNLKILQAIVDAHSSDDQKIREFFEDHDLSEKDYERYMLLVKILKDADALDRFRFLRKTSATLDEKYLRLANSKKLISFAKEINQLYYQKMKQLKDPIDVSFETKEIPCFHSISFDVFKIDSILKNGILSKSKLREKNLSDRINFDGGNMEDWISVVDTNYDPRKSHLAFFEFINRGIGFFAYVPKLFDGVKNIEEAYMTGYPYNKGNYPDEKYVYQEIPVEDIQFLYIAKDYKKADICELDYIYNSLEEDIIMARVKYYLKQTGFDKEKLVNQDLVLALEEYCLKLREYQALKPEEKEKFQSKMPTILESIRKRINREIQKMMHDYFCKVLHRKENEKITLDEVVLYELEKSQCPYQFLNDEEETVILINKEKSRDSKKK